MSTHAAGTFEVTLSPQPPYDNTGGVILSRIAVSKVFHGDLEGVSTGEMLSVLSPVEGSAGYVAVERFTGRLCGRAGDFVLQHTGTMTRGKPALRVSVVPDTGTGELAGLAGVMTIEIVEQKHLYTFEFTLGAAT